MERRAAMRANFQRCGFKAQPPAALDALGIEALNGTAGESMHDPPQR